jgi:hypothetical protein
MIFSVPFPPDTSPSGLDLHSRPSTCLTTPNLSRRFRSVGRNKRTYATMIPSDRPLYLVIVSLGARIRQCLSKIAQSEPVAMPPIRNRADGDDRLWPVSTVRGRAAIGPESGVNRTYRTPRNQRVCPSHWQLSRHSCLWAAVNTSRLRSDRVLSERGN